MVEHGATQTRAATADSPGVLNPTVDPQTTLDAVRTAKENSDYCFVFMHWGKETYSEITEEQREWAGKLTDSGADAIIGAHTHVLQGIEYVNGCPVMYGLGNYWFNSRERTTGLYEITMNTIYNTEALLAKRKDDIKLEDWCSDLGKLKKMIADGNRIFGIDMHQSGDGESSTSIYALAGWDSDAFKYADVQILNCECG
jgi:hypothetical protein